MRALDIYKQINNPNRAAEEAGVKSAQISEEVARTFNQSQGRIVSNPEITGNERLMDEGVRSTASEMLDSFDNAVDEINKSTYSFRKKPFDRKVQIAKREILSIQKKLQNREISEEEAARQLNQQQDEIANVEADPDYQQINKDIAEEDADIANSPTSKKYEALSQQVNLEENSSFFNWLKYEAPKEFGGSASEIGTQIATTYGPQIINGMVRKGLASMVATGGLETPVLPAVMAGIGVAEMGAGMYGLWKMRQNESEAEANDAYEQKVQQKIAFRERETGQPISEEEKLDIEIEAHKGLKDIIEQNNNLSLSDAAEVLAMGTPWKALSGVVKMGKASKFVAKLGKVAAGFEELGTATRLGRNVKNVAGVGLTGLLEQMEETDQYSITQQYLAGKYKDDNSFYDNLKESLGHRKQSIEFAATGKTDEGYEEDANYRNAARSGFILGGLMSGAGAVAKITKDESTFKRTAKDVAQMTPANMNDEKSVFRADLYTRYFAGDKANFLFEGLNNLAYTSKDPEVVKTAKEELVKAKEGQRLYDKISDNNPVLNDEQIAGVFHRAQHLTSKLEDMGKTEEAYGVEYAAKSEELQKVIANPELSQILAKKAKLDAIRENLDKYHNIKEEEKPSNIKAYENKLEEKYRTALNEYKDILEHTYTTEGQLKDEDITKHQDLITELTAVEQKRQNLDLVKSDLRDELVNLHTQKGAKEFLKREYEKTTAKKAAPAKPIDIETATVPEYEAHEKQQVAEGRLGYKINKIEREGFERNLNSRIQSGEAIEDVLADVNDNAPKLGKENVKTVSDAIKDKEAEIEATKKETADLTQERVDLTVMPSEMEPEDHARVAEIDKRLAELAPINAIDNTKFAKEAEKFRANATKYQEEIPAATDNAIKRRIKEKFLKGSQYVQDKFEKNPEYNDITTVKKEIKRVKNLKKIYESRNAPEMKASKEFEDFTNTLDAHIAKLEEIEKAVEERLESREARDSRIAKNETVLALNQLGLNPDGSIVEGKEHINSISKTIIGESDYNRVMADAKGELTLTHANILQQLLKDNMTDPARLEEAIANAKQDFISRIFALPNITRVYGKNGKIFNMYVENPHRMIKDLINGLSDKRPGAFDTKKISSVYKFFKEGDVAEFINDVNSEDRSSSAVPKEDLLAVIELHQQYVSLFDLENTLNSDIDLHTETSREQDFEEKSAADPNRKTPTPSNQQLVSIRQIVQFVWGHTRGREFDDVAYLKGYAGTGKTNVVIRWAIKMLGLKTNQFYLAGHNRHSAETLSSSLNKSAINPVEKLIADLPTMDKDIKLIVLDEAPGVTTDNIKLIGKLLHDLNKTRKANDKVKLLFMGDPNQKVANGKRSLIENPTSVPHSQNITPISPLTIRFRSDVAPIVDVQDLFIDQDQDLTKTTIQVKSNALDPTANPTLKLVGVNGSLRNFDADVMSILEARKDDRSRTRAIIVGTEADVAKYEAMLEAKGLTGTVQVMTDTDAQGRTINEVYTNIPYTNQYDNIKEYNTAMYTATSRATDYLYIGGFNVENNLSDTIEDNKAKKEAENKERSNKFIEQRKKELAMMDNLLPEKEKPVANTQEASTEPIVDEEYNDFIDNGIVPDSTLHEIADKIINGEELSDREKEIFADKTSEINDILREYHEQNGTTTEKETDAPLDEEIEIQEDFQSEESFVEVPTTYDDDATLDTIEGNPAATPAQETPAGRKVYSVNYPTGRSIAKKDSDGNYGPGVKPGDTVHYVKSYDSTTKKYYITIVSPIEGQKGRYYEVGVVSEKELKDGVNAQDPLFTLLQDAINDVTSETYPISTHSEEKGGTLKVTGFYPIADGKINHTQKIAYKYGASKPFNYFNIVGRFIKGFFPLGTRRSIDKLVKESVVRIYTKNEIGELVKKYQDRGQTIPFTPASGVPYLVINNISQGGEGESKQQFIRLTPAKLNKLKHSKYVKPVEKLINAIHKMTPYMGGIEFGTPEYSEIIKADTEHLQTLLPKLPAMDDETLAEFNQRREEIHNLVYVWEKERFSDNKDIKVNHHVQDTTEDRMFDGTGRVAKENKNKDGDIVSFNIKLKDGTLVTVPKENLERVAVEERKSGPAQIALNAIAKANANPNGLPIRTYRQVPVRGTNDFTVETAAKGLLIEHGETFSLPQLEELMAFDDEGNSKYIHVPLDIKYFKDDSKEKGFIVPNMSDYIADSFDEVLPSAISISRKSAIKEKEVAEPTPAPKPKLPELEPTRAVNQLPTSPTATHTFPIIVNTKGGSGKIYIPQSVAEKVYDNDIANKGHQSLERIGQRGGYYTSELNTLYPNWYNESVAELPSSISSSTTTVEEVLVAEPVTEAIVNENVPVKTQEEIDAAKKKLLNKGKNQAGFGKTKKKLLAKGRDTSLGRLIKDPFALVRKIIPSMSNDDLKVVSESVMLELTEGVEAWGHFKNGVIYLLEGAEGVYHKVVRHEAFHRIFNNHLTEEERNKLIATARRINPLLKSETPLKVEEWLAEQYQNWTTKKGTISLALLNAFKKILKFLGLYRANFDNIDKLFDAIDAGLLDKQGEVVEDSSRNLVKIRQDYLTTDHYRDSRALVIIGMNNRLNATQWNDEKGELEVIDLLKDGSNIKEATPMPFEEAISDLRTEFADMLTAYTEEVASNPEDVEWNTYQKEIYTILNDERKAKDLLKEIYPSLYLGNKEFTEGLATSDEEIAQEIEDAQTNGSIYEDIIESDRIDQESHVKRGVKDFLATIVDDGGNPVNPRMGYIKLLEGFVGVTTTNFKKLKEQIGLNMGLNEKSSNKVNAIYNKIIELITTADEGNAPQGKLVPNFEQAGYDFQNDDVYVYRNKYGNIQSVSRGKMTSVAFMKSIETLLNREEYNVNPNTINLQYKRAVAKEVLCQIRTSIGSQRKKNVMIAVRATTQWDSDTGKDFYAITYRYNSVREQGAKQNLRAAIETAFLTKGDSIPAELKKRFLTTKEDNSEATTKNIEDLIKFLGLGVPTIIKGEEYDVHASLKNLFQQVENIGKETEVMKANDDDQLAKAKEVFTWDKFLKDSNQRLEKLTDLLVKDSEDLRPVSYISGDGKKRYEWMNSSTAIDTLTHMTVGFKENRPDFVKSAIFLRNIFFGNNKDKKAHNKIHRFVDHDSIKDKDNKYRPTPYKGETYEQWMHRNINYTFTSLVGNSKLSKGIRYIQQFYTISNKPQTIGAEIDLKKASDIRAVVEEAIMQELERPELDAQNYTPNTSYLAGLTSEELQQLKELREYESELPESERHFGKALKDAVEKVHKGLDKVSEDLVNHLFDAKFVLDYEISKTQSKLLDHIDAKYKTTDGKALLEKHTLPPNLQSLQNKEYALTKDQLMPLMDLWAKNFYMNGHFLNQLVSGDQAFYKNPADQVKRMSMAFAMGYTGMVNDNGFMKETFKVAVADKLMFGITDKQFKKHRQFYGLKGEAADAQGYHTPGRAANIKRGFGKEMRLGAVMKPVYWGLNKLGIPQGMKYSTIELSDDLIYSDKAKTKVRFPELLALREEMELKGVDEYVFLSAFKVGAPTNLTKHNGKEQNVYTDETGKEVRGIDPKSIVELENKNWRIQLNPVHTLKGQTSHPTQITFFVDMDGKNTIPANKIFRLNGKLIKRGLDRVNRQLGGGNGNVTKLRKFFLDSLGDTDARIHDFMSATDEKGDPLLSLNFPTVVNKVVTQIASTVSKATVQVKYNGGKLALQSDFGYQFKDEKGNTRGLQIRTDVTVDGKKVQYAEVLMDNIYKDQFKEGDILFESALAFRIPSTELHSALPIKIVGFYDSKGSNVVIAPRELTILHGSDYDIDSLFIMRRTPYLPKIKKNESYADFAKRKGYKNLLIDGAIIGRKLDGEKIKDYIKTLEAEIKKLKEEKKTLTDKEEQKELQKTINLLDGVLDDAIKNEIVDTFLEVVTAKRNEARMLTPISMARFNDEKDPNSVFSKLKDIGVVTEKQYDLNNPLHQMQIHQDNFSGTAIVGAVADLVRGLAYVNQAYKPSSQKKLEYLSKGFAGHTMKTFDEQNEIIKGLTEQFKAKEITDEVYKEKVTAILDTLSKHYGVDWKTTPIDRGIEWMEMEGVPYTELAMKEKDSKGVIHTISDTFDALINAALDNVKEQILPIINLTNNTVKGYFGMLAVGMPLDFVVKQMLTPGIKNLSTARNMKFTLGETRTLVAGMIAADPKTATMTPEALSEFKGNVRFTEEALDNLVKKSLEEDFSIDKLTVEELIIQEKALTNFASANDLGEEIGKAAKATKILKQIPVAQEEIQDLVDLFAEIKAAKTGLLSKIDMMKIPHIKEAHNSLVKVSGIVNNQFYKHREEINNVAKEIIKSTGIKLDSNSNKSKRMVREEIMRMFMSGFTYKADGITIDLNTSDEYPFNPFKISKKGEQLEIEDAKPLTGLNAFNQRFAEDVLNAKKANPTNLFLDKIRVAPQLGAGKNMYQVEYNTTAAMEASEVQDLQDAFNELKVDGKYTAFQHMFVKYAALNQGLSFGLSSYSLLLPAEIYAGFDAQMNKFFSTLLSQDEARQPDVVKARMDKLTDYFSAKLARQYPSKLATNKEFVVKPGTIYPMQGYDTMTDGSIVHYELKFKHEDAEKTTQTVPEGNEKDELITDNYEKSGLPSSEAQDAPTTPDDENLTKEIKINGFPQFLSYYDKSYVKVESRTGDPFVYYQYLSVEKKGAKQGYEFDRNVLFFGYSVKDVFRRDIKTRVVPKASDQNVYESEVKYSNFKVGDTISLRTLNDAERLNSFDYTIAKETYYKGKTEVASREEAGENGTVVYDLKDGRKVISFNREELSEDDIKDLDNLCK